MTKKSALFVAVIVLCGGAAAYFAYWTNQQNQQSFENAAKQSTVTREIKTSDVFDYLGKQSDLSSAEQFLSVTDTATLMAADPPNSKLIVFAARNSAFKTDEGKHLADVSADGQNLIRQYQFAVVPPTASADLKDGMQLTTLSKRQLMVKKQAGRFYIIDAKGRQAQVESTYISNTTGTQRLYITNLILLPQ